MLLNLDIPEKVLDKNYIKQFLPENPIIIEAGGHIGRDCIKMAKLWPQSTIYSFEPVKELYNKLVENTKEFKNIICYNYALSDYNGHSEIYISSGRSTALSSFYKPIQEIDIIAETEFTKDIVKVTTLDKWSQDNNIKKIDFIWLDVQGAELAALNGSKKLIKNIKVIFVEVNLIARYENSTNPLELISWIQKQGFTAIAHDKIVHGKTNILFIK